jgi:tryptophanyl-tRNA synthetase
MYCGVSDQAPDADHVKLGGVFPVPVADVGTVGKLMGYDGKQKMSKSLGNAIFITDSDKDIRKKVAKLFTGRQSPTEPGDPTNVLFQYVECFIDDKDRVAELKDRYARGDNIGDGHIKQEVADAINELLEPMRQRRAQYEGNDDTIMDILKSGCAHAIEVTEETLALAKEAARLGFFEREVRYR